MPRRRRRNPWTSMGEILVWLLFVVLLFPAGFAGWAVGHYTSLGKAPSTVVRTVTVGSTAAATTAAATTSAATTSGATTSAATTTSSSTSGNAAAGKSVFAANSCASCHTFKAAGATGTIGPNLDTQPAVDAKLTHLSIAAYVKQCITDPYKFVPKGYPSGVMPATYGKSLSSSQLNDLIAFIVSSTSKS